MEVQEEKIMDRIQKLIDKAMSTTFQAEQDALLQKADALMMQYSIDQVRLAKRAATAGNNAGSVPIYKSCLVQDSRVEGDAGDEVFYAIHSMFQSLVNHFHCTVTRKVPAAAGGGQVPRGHMGIVGFPSDIEFMEMLFVQLKMHMLSNLAPTVDPSRPWIEAMANMKNTGMKWVDIHYAIRHHPEYPWRNQPWERKIGVSFTARYRKFMEEAGADRVMTSSPQTWRSDFIAGYVTTIRSRLAQMRQQTINEGDNLPALFKDKDAEVMEEFYQMFPEDRPHPSDCKCDRCEMHRKPIRLSGKGSRGGASSFRYRNTGAMNAGGRVASTADLSGRGSRVGGGTKGSVGS